MTVGIGIVTLNAAKQLPALLEALRQEPGWDAILVVDSSSADGTAAIAEAHAGVQCIVAPPGEFNHGATRELLRRELHCDIVVLLTQDIAPEPGFLSLLVEPIKAGEAAVAYARQLPRAGAGFFESFPREFNYPAESQVRALADVPRYGVYTFFCSDSCAAYANAALDAVGGFEPVLTNEDYFAVARLLRAGHWIKYVAEARVLHSHRYTLGEEFRRYFDTGYVRAEHPWVTQLVGRAERRGARFAREMLWQLARRAPLLVPYAVIQTAVKWLGFRVGFMSRGWPRWWCRRLSSQPYYWSSRYFPPAGQ
jgi:rhamnosyltransferase